jgi:succinyl-diaminopimelate desuccinylase
MKSALAAMVHRRRKLPLPVVPITAFDSAYLITSDEEGPSVEGTKKVVEHLMSIGEQITWCAIGEPTSDRTLGDTVKIGSPGIL